MPRKKPETERKSHFQIIATLDNLVCINEIAQETGARTRTDAVLSAIHYYRIIVNKIKEGYKGPFMESENGRCEIIFPGLDYARRHYTPKK